MSSKKYMPIIFTQIVQKMVYDKKDVKNPFMNLSNEWITNEWLSEFYQNIISETAILDFQLLRSDL